MEIGHVQFVQSLLKTTLHQPRVNESGEDRYVIHVVNIWYGRDDAGVNIEQGRRKRWILQCTCGYDLDGGLRVDQLLGRILCRSPWCQTLSNTLEALKNIVPVYSWRLNPFMVYSTQEAALAEKCHVRFGIQIVLPGWSDGLSRYLPDVAIRYVRLSSHGKEWC